MAGVDLNKIAGEIIAFVLKGDVISRTGTLQVCDGQRSSVEATIQSMKMMYENKNTNAVLLADTSNAFISLNRFLYNITSFYISI